MQVIRQSIDFNKISEDKISIEKVKCAEALIIFPVFN